MKNKLSPKLKIVTGLIITVLILMIVFIAWPKENLDRSAEEAIRQSMAGDITFSTSESGNGWWSQCQYLSANTKEMVKEEASTYYNSLEQRLKADGWKVTAPSESNGIRQASIKLDRGIFRQDLEGNIHMNTASYATVEMWLTTECKETTL